MRTISTSKGCRSFRSVDCGLRPNASETCLPAPANFPLGEVQVSSISSLIFTLRMVSVFCCANSVFECRVGAYRRKKFKVVLVEILDVMPERFRLEHSRGRPWRSFGIKRVVEDARQSQGREHLILAAGKTAWNW